MVADSHGYDTVSPWKNGLGLGPLCRVSLQIGHLGRATELDSLAQSFTSPHQRFGGRNTQKVEAELFAQLLDSASQFVRIIIHQPSNCTNSRGRSQESPGLSRENNIWTNGTKRLQLRKISGRQKPRKSDKSFASTLHGFNTGSFPEQDHID